MAISVSLARAVHRLIILSYEICIEGDAIRLAQFDDTITLSLRQGLLDPLPAGGDADHNRGRRTAAFRL